MAFVLEGDVGQFQLAVAFDKNLLRAVDQNIVDGVVFQQRFKRAEAFDLVVQLLVQRMAFVAVQNDAAFLQEFGCDCADFVAQVLFRRGFQRGQVQTVQQGAVQFQLDLAHTLFAFAFLFNRRNGRGGDGRAPGDAGRIGLDRCRGHLRNLGGRRCLRGGCTRRCCRGFFILGKHGLPPVSDQAALACSDFVS